MPHPRQVKALESKCYETLYGGSRGGGKTDAGLANCLYDVDNPKLRQLVIRRNYDDLKDWIDRARAFFRPQKAVFRLSTKEIVFPTGAKILLGHLKDDGAYTKYQGHEYQRMLIEELTHIPNEELYLKLISSCRSTVPGLSPQIFATTNPGEVGHRWVKKRFVDVCDPESIFTDPKTGRTRIFIPARVSDNPTLMENDPDYIHFLSGLPDGLREQWLDGSWEDITIKGAYYTKQIEQAQREGRISRLPFDPDIPTKFFFDLGISKTDSLAVWCTQEYGKEIRIVKCWEFFETSIQTALAEIFKSKYGKYVERMYFPHDIRVREFSDGETRLETVLRVCRQRKVEVSVVPAMNPEERVHALRLIFPRLFFDEVECEGGLDALKSYRKEYDEKKGVYKDNPLRDWSSHYADSAGMIGVVSKTEFPVEENYGEAQKRVIHRDLTGGEDLEDDFDENPFGF